MRYLIFIVTLFLGVNCIASAHFDILRDTLAKGSTLAEFKLKLDSKFEDFTLSTKKQLLERKLDFGFSQTLYELEIMYNTNYVKKFRIYLFTNSNDSIIIGTLQEIDYSQEVKRAENYIENNTIIDSYLEKHETTYKISISKYEFIQQITNLKVYGFGCGGGDDYYPQEALQMLSYVRAKNCEKLSLWIRQVSPELQAYGIRGLISLHKKGILLNKTDKEIIQNLRKRNSNINICAGCIFGISATLKELIKW